MNQNLTHIDAYDRDLMLDASAERAPRGVVVDLFAQPHEAGYQDAQRNGFLMLERLRAGDRALSGISLYTYAGARYSEDAEDVIENPAWFDAERDQRIMGCVGARTHAIRIATAQGRQDQANCLVLDGDRLNRVWDALSDADRDQLRRDRDADRARQEAERIAWQNRDDDESEIGDSRWPFERAA